jgi:hypothetical protein
LTLSAIFLSTATISMTAFSGGFRNAIFLLSAIFLSMGFSVAGVSSRCLFLAEASATPPL